MEPNLLSLSKPKRSVLANMGINHSLSKLWVTPSYLLLSTHDFFFPFSLLPPKSPICPVIWTPSHPSLNIDQIKIWNSRTFAADLHEILKKKKKGAQELKRYLWSLWVGGCAKDRRLQVWNCVLFIFFGFWYYKIMVAMKIGFFTQMGQNI